MLNIELPYGSTIYSFGHTQKNLRQELRYLSYNYVHNQHYLYQPKGGSNLKCPSTDDWINKLLYIHSMAPLIFFSHFFPYYPAVYIFLQLFYSHCLLIPSFLLILCLFLLSDFFFLLLVQSFCLYMYIVNFLLDAEFWEFYIVGVLDFP